MRKNIIPVFILFIFVFTQLSLSAQNDQGQDRWEKYRTEKIAFLTDNLELSPEEAQKFWPVYNKLDKERWEAQKLRRDMEHELRATDENLSEANTKELTRKFAGSMKKEGDLLVSYNEKFLEILPAKKVLQLYKAENEFRMHMIQKYRGQRKDGDKHP